MNKVIDYEGEVLFEDNVLPYSEAVNMYEELSLLEQWQGDELKMFGKQITTARKVIWFGDEGCNYTYSGTRKSPIQWHPLVLDLKLKLETQLNQKFNSCLGNLYHSGEEGMGWHSDDEVELGDTPYIAVISLGAERKFKLKHKRDKTVVDVYLKPGSLLVMQGECQKNWWHCLPKTKRVSAPRISLTFRSIVNK